MVGSVKVLKRNRKKHEQISVTRSYKKYVALVYAFVFKVQI